MRQSSPDLAKSPNIIAAVAAMIIAFSVAVVIILPVPQPWNLIGFPTSIVALFVVYTQVNKPGT